MEIGRGSEGLESRSGTQRGKGRGSPAQGGGGLAGPGGGAGGRRRERPGRRRGLGVPAGAYSRPG